MQPNVDQLITACQREQAQGGDGNSCLELARRGLIENNGPAWTAFETQFMALIHLWLHEEAVYHSLAPINADDTAELWADARARFVSRYGIDGAVDNGSAPRFGDRFAHLGALLKTLRLCIRSTLQAQARQRARTQRLTVALTPMFEPQSTSLEAQIEADELRLCVQSQIAQDVPEDHLQRLLEYRFSMDLKPREIQAHCPELFPTTNHVHRALEQVMKRLRRRVDIYLERCL